MSELALRRPFVIGVTGNIATGKSAVVAMLAELGAATIDSDVVYHHLIRPGLPLWQSLRDHFGEAVIAEDGTLNRKALGQLVFSDPDKLAELDALTHPAVIQAVKAEISTQDAVVVAIDAVKLIESGMSDLCDVLWLVECSQEVQLDRLMRRNGLTRDEALQRVRSQPGSESKRALVDEIIDNSGSMEETRRQVQVAWARLPLLPS